MQELAKFTASLISPRSVYSASTRQLKRLVLCYRANCESATHSILWHTGIVYLANALVEDVSDPSREFYFRLCLSSYRDLFASFRIAKGVLQGLLSIAISRDMISGPEARLFMKHVNYIGKHHRLVNALDMTWILDLNLALTDPEAAQVDVKAGEYKISATQCEIDDLDGDRGQGVPET